jgi:hypothetical protein
MMVHEWLCYIFFLALDYSEAALVVVLDPSTLVLLLVSVSDLRRGSYDASIVPPAESKGYIA